MTLRRCLWRALRLKLLVLTVYAVWAFSRYELPQMLGLPPAIR